MVLFLYVPYEYKENAKRDGCECKKFEAIDIEDGTKSTKWRWYVLKTNPKYNYCVELYNQYNFNGSFYGTKLNSNGNIVIDKYNKHKSEEKCQENKFNDDDINDIIGFIENSKKSKKSKI